MSQLIRHFCLVSMIFAVCNVAATALADKFTYVERDGSKVEVEARLVGSGRGQHVLELADGQYRLVAQAAVLKREISEGPEPLTPDQVIEQLATRFGRTNFRGYAEGHFVIGLILGEPLPKSLETRAKSCLKKSARFMSNVERNFKAFTKRMRIETRPPTHPLVLLVFESDDDFEKYNSEITGGRGMSAGATAGFYSPITNWLAIRMSECLTFATPLHEAIHQQVFNQHVLQRLAPTPAWFNEGIATGFEGNGDRINRGPSKVSVRYSRMVHKAKNIDWQDLVNGDKAFRGDIFAGEAYIHAWSMHWLLVSRYKDEYVEYIRNLAKKTPFQEQSASQRKSEFEDIFGKSTNDLQSEFPKALQSALKRQRLPKEKPRRRGELTIQSNLAEVTVMAIGRGGLLETEGAIRNISAIRPMTFHIVVQTNSGKYADWVIPNLGINKTARLPRQLARKMMRGAPGGASTTFGIRVNSAAPTSENGRQWKAGNTPVPTFR